VAASPPDIDESLYSRQLSVIGVDAMRRLASSSVLVSGLGGLGAEIAKNLILAGVKSLTVHDSAVAQLSDVASNFCLSESSVGANRALASFAQLKTLNDSVSVSAATGPLTEDLLRRFQCVVVTDGRRESELRRIAGFCHASGVKLVLAETRGVFGYVFADVGADHVANERPGSSRRASCCRTSRAMSARS
jgi:ubiquitin-activating enzyme E1